MTRIKISALALIIVLIICMLPVSVSADTVTWRLKGDINNDGVITVDDARLLMRACTGLDTAPKAGTDEFQVYKLTHTLPDEITMEDVRKTLRTAIGLGNYGTAYTNTEAAELLNKLTNRIKSDEFKAGTTMSGATEITISKTLEEYDIGETVGMIEKMLDETSDFIELPKTEYQNEFTGKEISDDTFPLEYSANVLNLKDSDIKSFEISFNQTANVYSQFPETTTEIASLIKTARRGLVKIHLELVTEKYTEIKNSGEDTKSPIKRFCGYDIVKAGSPYSLYQSQEDEKFSHTNILTTSEITADASADFYFTPVTYTPVAAVYTVNQVADVDIHYIESTESESPFVTNEHMTCTATENKVSVYTFDSYYKNI